MSNTNAPWPVARPTGRRITTDSRAIIAAASTTLETSHWLFRPVLRSWLHEAEKAIDRPFDIKASHLIDALDSFIATSTPAELNA